MDKKTIKMDNENKNLERIWRNEMDSARKREILKNNLCYDMVRRKLAICVNTSGNIGFAIVFRNMWYLSSEELNSFFLEQN